MDRAVAAPSERTISLSLRRHANGTPEIRLSLRAAVGLSVPLVVGLLINQRLYAIVVAIGALWAISQDGLDEWRVRGPRLLGVALTAAVGVGLGATFVGHEGSDVALTLFFGAVALLAGYVEASNRATQGAYLLIGAIIGAGLQFSGKVWQSCLAIALGALWVYLIAALTDRRKRLANQRVFLAHAFDALASLLEAVGTPHFFDVRARAVASLDAAQDVLGSQRLRTGSSEEVALRRSLLVALRCGEVVSYLEGKGLSVNAAVPAALRGVGATLRTGTGLEAAALLDELPKRFQALAGLDPIVTSTLTLSDAEVLDGGSRVARRSPTRYQLPVLERLRFGVILCLAIVLGTIVARALDGPHGFWLPLSVAFILRPDLGPVVTRALARTLGTVVGVGIAVLVSWSGNSVGLLIALSCVMAALQPWAARRSHVLAVITFTPIVFVFLSLLGTDSNLFAPRIIDTALGAAIVLVLDVALWTTAPSLRPAAQLALARAASSRYEREATYDDAMRRHVLRRRALRAIAHARSSLDHARAEPRALRRNDTSTLDELNDIERSLDAHTVMLLEGHSS